MVAELRLYPWSPAARSRGRCPGERTATGTRGLGRGLSTAFAHPERPRCTAAMAVVHSAISGKEKEVVG
jgi:hypothetical protein